MSKNIVNQIWLREVGSRNCFTIDKALTEIDYLFEKECYFDHPLINDIYIILRDLVLFNINVRNKVLSVNWDIEFGGIKSIVLFARKIAREDVLNIPEIKRLGEISLVITDDDFSRE
jgi:hypothetical protein